MGWNPVNLHQMEKIKMVFFVAKVWTSTLCLEISKWPCVLFLWFFIFFSLSCSFDLDFGVGEWLKEGWSTCGNVFRHISFHMHVRLLHLHACVCMGCLKKVHAYLSHSLWKSPSSDSQSHVSTSSHMWRPYGNPRFFNGSFVEKHLYILKIMYNFLWSFICTKSYLH